MFSYNASRSEISLKYKVALAGYEVDLYYTFGENGLYDVSYVKTEEFGDLNEYTLIFMDYKRLLEKKYGKPDSTSASDAYGYI